MDLVLLPFEPAEEALDAFPLRAVPFDDKMLLLVGELRPGNVEADAFPGHALQFGELRPIVRFAPGFDRVLLDRLRRIGDDEIHVELDDVAEAVAHRARTERIVEREEPRLRDFVLEIARTALEFFREPDHALVASAFRRRAQRFGGQVRRKLPRRRGIHIDRESRPTPFRVGGLDRIGQPRPHVRIDLHAIDDDLQRGPVFQHAGVDILEADRPPLEVQAAEAFAPERRQRLCHRIHQVRQIRLRGCALPLFTTIRRDLFLLPLRLARGERRRLHDRHLESDHQPCPFGERGKTGGDHFRGLADHFLPAGAAERPPHPCVQKPEIVVNLGGRTNGRSRVADAVLLTDGDRRADAFDAVDVRLFHPLEKLASVSRQRLDVAALPFGVDGVKRERRLTGPAHPCHHHERARRQRQVDVLQVMSPCAPDDNLAGDAFAGCLHLCGEIRQIRNSPS